MSPARFRLQRLIDEAGTTQSEIARQTGIAFTTINRICNNVTAQVSLKTLDKLASALGCQPGDIIERVPEKKGKGR